MEITASSPRDECRLRDARALEAKLDWITATLDPRASRRPGVDAETVLATFGQVAQPDREEELQPVVLDESFEALLGSFRLSTAYNKPAAPARIVKPTECCLGRGLFWSRASRAAARGYVISASTEIFVEVGDARLDGVLNVAEAVAELDPLNDLGQTVLTVETSPFILCRHHQLERLGKAGLAAQKPSAARRFDESSCKARPSSKNSRHQDRKIPAAFASKELYGKR